MKKRFNPLNLPVVSLLFGFIAVFSSHSLSQASETTQDQPAVTAPETTTITTTTTTVTTKTIRPSTDSALEDSRTLSKVHSEDSPKKTVSIDEATQKAIGDSPQLDQTRAQAERAKWERLESLSGFLPSVTLGGHWYFLERTPYFNLGFGSTSITSLGPASPWYDGEVSVKVPLFDGLRNFDRLDAAGKQGHAATLQVDWGTYQLRQQVRLAYNAVLEAKQLAIVANEDVKDLEDHRRLIQDQIRAGVSTRVDTLRVDSQLSFANSERTNAEDEIKIRLRQLAELMGEQFDDRDVTGKLPIPSDSDLRAIESATLGSRYDIDALALTAEAASDQQRAASKWWVPTLSLVGNYDAYSSQALKLTAYTIGVSMSVNIFDGLVSYSRSKEAIQSERIADKAETQSRLQAETDFETYRRRYRYNLERYRARVDDVARATETVRLARVGFKAGTQTNTDVLDAEQDLFNARSNEVQAQYGALENLVRFELALGRNISP
jgi:outer membrane protein TolC